MGRLCLAEPRGSRRRACYGGAWGNPKGCMAHEGAPIEDDGYCLEGRPSLDEQAILDAAARKAAATREAHSRQLGLFGGERFGRGARAKVGGKLDEAPHAGLDLGAAHGGKEAPEADPDVLPGGGLDRLSR